MNNFKVGDFVYNDFELNQIVEMNNNLVTELTDGIIRKSGNNLLCYQLTLRNKNISEYIKELYNKIQSIRGLNYPIIHRYYIKIWCDCINENDKNDENLDVYYKKLKNFNKEIFDRLNFEVDGIKIFD